MTLIIQWNNCEYSITFLYIATNSWIPFYLYGVRSLLVLLVPSLFANWEMKHENIVKIKSDLTRNFLFLYLLFFIRLLVKRLLLKAKILSLERCCPRFKRFYNFLLLYVTSCASSLMRFSAHFILSTCFNWTCFTTSRFYFQYVDISKMIKYFLYLEFLEISNELRTVRWL